jgi:hypothetical protein
MQNNTPSLDQLKRATAIAERIQALEGELAAIFNKGSSAQSSSPSAAAPSSRGPGKGKATGKRTMSPEARERIAAAQRARWAKTKGGTSSSAQAPKAAASASSGGAAPKKKTGLTPEGRAKLAASMKARWAARKKGAPAPTAKK